MNAQAQERSLDGKTVLVTGAGGYIGSAVIEILAGRDCTIIRSTRQRSLPPAPADRKARARIETLTGEPSSPAFWRQSIIDMNVDIVFHFAAQNSVYESEKDPEADWRANVLPMVHLLHTAADCGRCVDVVMAGTATEVGLTESLPVDETVPDRPVTVYDLHKLTAERYLELYAARGAIRGTTLRLANVYGPGASVSSADRGILNKIVRAALQGSPITVFGDGSEVRDYVYIDDVARAFIMAAEHIERANGRHFFIGSGVAHTLKEAFSVAADRVRTRTGQAVEIKHAPWPDHLSPIERRNFVANVTAVSDAIDWRPTISLKEGIDRTIEASLGNGE